MMLKGWSKVILRSVYETLYWAYELSHGVTVGLWKFYVALS